MSQALHSDGQFRRRVFVSYACEDIAQVSRLYQWLQSASIPTWMDQEDLRPGQDWGQEIERMIHEDSVAFLACFSASTQSKKSERYWYRELRGAMDRMASIRPGTPWLIPVRFDDCELPDFSGPGGRSLSAFQRVDLFGDRAEKNARALLEVLYESAGVPRPQRPPLWIDCSGTESAPNTENGREFIQASPSELLIPDWAQGDHWPAGTALMVKGTTASFPVYGDRAVATPKWVASHLAERLQVLQDSGALPGIFRRGWDPAVPWTDAEARERARRYWKIGKNRVAGWIERPDTAPRELILGIPENGRTVIRYSWEVDREGIWEAGENLEWFGVPLGRQLTTHPALGTVLVQEKNGTRKAALAGYAGGWRIIPVAW